MPPPLPYGETLLTPNLTLSFWDLPKRTTTPEPLREDAIAQTLYEALPDGRNLCILLPDGTRPLPVAHLLDLLEPRLAGREVTIVIANGTHRHLTREEIERHLGPVPSTWKVLQNPCDDPDAYREIGRTKRGTPVQLHRAVVESDAVLALSLVRPHYYAGFSGGRKIFLPGCASRETIQANHRFVLDRDPAKGKNPAATLGRLSGNPVHEDMADAFRLVREDACIAHFVMEGEDIVFAKDGREEAFNEAVAFIRQTLETPVEEPYDAAVISVGGAPRDCNFIQSHKAIENVVQAVKPGGAVYLYAECPEGLGSDDMESYLRIGEIPLITRRLHEKFKIYGHTALSLLIKARTWKIHLHSELDDNTCELLNLHPWDGVSIPDEIGKTLLVPDASNIYFTRRRENG